MKIFFHNHRISISHGLKKAGYHKRSQGDWIRENGVEGRFHAHVIDNMTADLHYDLIIDHRHTVFPMPITMHTELRRIFRKNNFYSKGPMPKELLYSLLKKYGHE